MRTYDCYGETEFVHVDPVDDGRCEAEDDDGKEELEPADDGQPYRGRDDGCVRGRNMMLLWCMMLLRCRLSLRLRVRLLSAFHHDGGCGVCLEVDDTTR